MRWERLFQDFEDQLDRETDAELEDMARDEERLRIGRLTLNDRLRAVAGSGTTAPRIRVRVGASDFECVVTRVGRDWMLVDVLEPIAHAGSALVPLVAVSRVEFGEPDVVAQSIAPSAAQPATPTGLVTAATPPAPLTNDIGLIFVLRDLCRRRRIVAIVGGGFETTGVIERVGQDFVDVSTRLPGAMTPRAGRGATSVFALAHIDFVRLG